MKPGNAGDFSASPIAGFLPNSLKMPQFCRVLSHFCRSGWLQTHMPDSWHSEFVLEGPHANYRSRR
jgi:hypothetical protein